VGMTGEITLRGRVLPIGGLKEKVMAAHRAGLKTMILPRKNEKDMVEIPRKILSDLKFILVDHMDEVLKEALLTPRANGIKRKSSTRPTKRPAGKSNAKRSHARR
jgi:ATP-dependent Lon protease